MENNKEMNVPSFLEAQPKQEMPKLNISEAEIDKVKKIVKGFTNDEKMAAVRSIPSQILLNEICRRMKRDYEYTKAIRQLTENLDDY